MIIIIFMIQENQCSYFVYCNHGLNHTPIKKLSIEKDNKWGFKKEKQVFMLVEAEYNKYEYVLKNIKPTIQEPFGTDIGWGQLYRCFFVQEE